MTASPVDVKVNPNNTDQRYVAWGTGRIEAVGGAVPIVGQATWYGALYQPVVVAIHIIDWATGAGYQLDLYGATHAFNGAPDLANFNQTVPYTNPTRRYVDWAWNPDGSGQGYVLDQYGKLYPFGGAAVPPRAGARFTWPAARKLQMRWAPDVRAITMDLYGGLHGDFALPSALAPFAYWPNWDAARDFVVTDWATPGGYVLDLWGGVHGGGGAAGAVGSTVPYRKGADVARCLAVISAVDPLHLFEVWSGGQQFDWISSTPPTVTAGGIDTVSPAANVADTTRPTLAWDYNDPQNNSQLAYQVYVFTEVYAAGHDMTDPDSHAADALVNVAGSDRTLRGVPCPIDLPNGSYREYVRAQDSAEQWSAWSVHAWTQAVPLPAAPTALTAVPDTATLTVTLTATAAPGEADYVRFEASDDGELTWTTVDDADAVPLAASTSTVDWAPPLGLPRVYRAVAWSADPAVASVPSATATATVGRRVHALTSRDDPTLGGEIRVESADWSRPIVSGVFQALGDDEATVVSDGPPKGRRVVLDLWSLDRATWDLIAGLAQSNSTLIYRDPFGGLMYCRLAGGDWTWAQLRARATPDELTPVRHAHTTGLPLVEVRRPA